MENIFYPLCWGLVAVCSIPLNLLCFVVLKRAKNMEDVTKVFLNSLTAADLIYCLFRVVPAVSISAIGRVLLGEFFCTIQSFAAQTSVYALYPTLLAINVERYLCITYPLRYRLIVAKRKAIYGMICVWSISICLNMWMGFDAEWTAHLDVNIFSCRLMAQNSHSFIVNNIVTYVAMAIIVVTVILIIKMYMTAKNFYEKRSAFQNHVARHVRKNRKAATTCFLMTFTFLLANVPWIIVALLDKFDIKSPPHVLFVSELMFGLAGIGDVIVYYFRNRSFKKTTKKVVSQLLHFKCIC